MGKTAWIVIACLGLFAVIFFVSLMSFLGSTASEGDLISIRGVGNSGNTVYSSSARRRAIKALGLDRGVPEITDAMLREMVASVVERAAKGEPEAVDFVLELARAQREAAPSPLVPAPSSAGR